MCLWSDGLVEDVEVTSVYELQDRLVKMMDEFNPDRELERMVGWQSRFITERQFAEFVGRCRMYQYMSMSERCGLPKLEFGDSQINQVVDGYYNDENFSRESDGSINLWNLYNLFTGANKSSYIDRFLERSVNAGDVIRNLAMAL